MNLSKDESRALSFVALVLALSAGVRLIDRPRPVAMDAAGVDLVALEAASRAAGRKDEPAPLAPGEKIDPNTARIEDLLRLPRMSRTVADAVIRVRTTTPIRTLADLDRVPGVGPVALETWAPHLKLAALPPMPIAAPAGGTKGGPVALNTATPTELERLPGIGPALAARIIAWRDSAGGFRDLNDLAKVRGIGPATLARLKPLLAL